MWARALALVSVVALRTASAQTPRIVRGTVFDHRDQPIVSAAVIATGGAGAVTDDSGRFRLEISHKDRLTFEVRRVGFLPSRVGLHAGGDTDVTVLLLPATQILPGVAVTAAPSRAPSLAGFEQRMRERERGAGTGRFITAKEIERMSVNRTTQVLETDASITVRRVGTDRYAVFGKSGAGGSCSATIFLDGIRLMWGGQPTYDRRGRIIGREPGAPIDEYVVPQEVAGVEIYPRAMMAPPQFQPPVNDDSAMRCAVVVVWTKHG